MHVSFIRRVFVDSWLLSLSIYKVQRKSLSKQQSLIILIFGILELQI